METCKLKCQLHHKTMNGKVKQMIFVMIAFAIEDSLSHCQDIFFTWT